MDCHRKIAIWATDYFFKFIIFGFSLTTTTGSGSSSLTGSTGSFVILILGFAFTSAFDFALTGFTSSSIIVSTTAS